MLSRDNRLIKLVVINLVIILFLIGTIIISVDIGGKLAFSIILFPSIMLVAVNVITFIKVRKMGKSIIKEG